MKELQIIKLYFTEPIVKPILVLVTDDEDGDFLHFLFLTLLTWTTIQARE